jgi:hypothetical protein
MYNRVAFFCFVQHVGTATSFLFTVHKPFNQLVRSLPFNPKLCVPAFSTIFNACWMEELFQGISALVEVAELAT